MLKLYTIYTDGSDLKKTTRRLGVGGVLLDSSDKLIGQFGEELNRKEIEFYYGTSQCSNPFAEMMAVKIALIRFSEIIGPKPAKIIVKSDYEGVQGWITGKWKAKEPYILQVLQEILEIIDNSPWIVEFQWVKGHQRSIMSKDSIYNNMVDKLAKGEL